ncbi:MAG: DUF4221 family protein [Chitinophagales bacterium]|nr:DUF4221 family protein [Chitinophagales bacterium]
MKTKILILAVFIQSFVFAQQPIQFSPFKSLSNTNNFDLYSVAIERNNNLPKFYTHVLLYNNNETNYMLCYNQSRKVIDYINMDSWEYAGNIDLKSLNGYNLDETISSFNIQNDKLLIMQEDYLYVIQLNGLRSELLNKYVINDEKQAFYKNHTLLGDINFKPILNEDGSVYLMSSRYDVMVNDPEYYKGNNEVRLFLNDKKLRTEFVPITYPENYRNGYYGYYFLPKREVNNNNMHIYSYTMSPEIKIWNPESNEATDLIVRSAYHKIDATPLDPIAIKDNTLLMKFTIEAPVYTSLKYDSYRDIYYRFFRPEIKEGEDCNTCTYKNKPLIIMILDNGFNIIDELYMATSIYEEQTSFVGPEGLYLSCANINNPDFGNNYISYDILKVNTPKKAEANTDSNLKLIASNEEGFYISGALNDASNAVVTIFDLSGRIVYRDIYYENKIISLPQIAKGIYMIQIANNNDRVVLKWIKN